MEEHFSMVRNQRGFTLVELLVVIVIISILAAISIPLFFRQRDRGYTAQMESSLKNAASAMQAYATEHGGGYPSPLSHPGPDPEVLTDEGYRPTEDVSVTIIEGSSTAYCLLALHSQTAAIYSYDSAVGKPAPGSC